MSERVIALRFIINGLVATAVHYATLVILIELVGVRSAGLANGLAAILGIAASYIGNRSHVFRSDTPHAATLPRFLAVYFSVAWIHAGGLYLWTDLMGLPYQAGFVLTTGLSVVLTYVANRHFVFRPPIGYGRRH